MQSRKEEKGKMEQKGSKKKAENNEKKREKGEQTAVQKAAKT